MSPSISVNNLQYSYGANTVLSIERLVFEPGTTALLGPNGAGKSTLLRMFATVTAPPSDTVFVDGRDVTIHEHRLWLRRQLGYAAQLDNLPPRMRVGEYCDYVAALKEISPRRRRRRWTEYVLGEVGLGECDNDRIGTLSGGMRRRLVLAQALLGSPRLLVLDEPLVSLDAEHRSSIARMIAASSKEQSTVVATHHGDELAAVCQRVVILVDGRVAFADTPDILAARAAGQVWETAYPLAHPAARALGPDRFRVVGAQPHGGYAVEPTVHDGYLAVLSEERVS